MNIKKYGLVLICFILTVFFVVSCKPQIEYVYKTSISLQQMPLKTEYFEGEKLDLNGLIITSVAENGNIIEIDDFSVEPENGTILEEAGTQTVTVTYKGRKLDFNVNVNKIENTGLYITSIPKSAYYEGEPLDLSNLKLELHKSNGAIETVTDYISEPVNGSLLQMTENGKQTVRIIYSDLECQFNVSILDVLLTNLYIKNVPEKIVYYTDDILELDGIVVEATFNDGSTRNIQDFSLNYDTTMPLKNVGTQTVTVSYLDKTADFQILVSNSIFAIVEQPVSKQYELYSANQILTYKVLVDGDGTLVYSLLKRNPNESEFVEVYRTEAIDVTFGNVYEGTVVAPNNNYVLADYVCKATITKGKTVKSVETDTVTIEQYLNSNIPLLRLNTSDGNMIESKEDYVSASFDLVAEDYDDLYLDEIKIKGRGNTSWKQPKKPYTIKFDKKNKVLGMAKSKKWVLVANYSDKTLLRNYYVSQIGNDIFTGMKWNPAFRPVDLILNNEYMGTYILGEQVKIEENRVNIQSAADTFVGDGKDLNNDGVVDINDGGFIVEVNKRLDENFNFTTTKGICISLKDPDTDDFEKGSVTLSEENENYIKNIIQTAEDVLYSKNWLDSENGYEKYIDTNSFIDWFFVNEFTKNNDAKWYSSVYIYYNPVDKKLYMGPDWDFDISCGNINYNGCDDYEGFWIKQSGWHNRLFKDSNFVEKTKERWNEIKLDLYNSINQTLQSDATEVSKSASYNFIRWNILGTYVWPNANGYEERITYQNEVDYMVEWLNNRYLWMDSAINNL